MSDKKLRSVKLDKIKIQDPFWNKYIDLVDNVILPFQWELINDRVEGAEKSYCIYNFKVASGEIEGEHRGMVFQDTDVAKWLEAVAFSLAKKKNEDLEKIADEAIDLIGRAQCEDGYLNTYYTITKQERWSDLFEGHELYTAGHMIEAAVAYYDATGKDKFLNIVCRFADYMCTVFGEEEGKIHGYPGHPEVELALVKLYRITQKEEYLKLADYFIRQRGAQPCYFLNESCIKEGKYLFPEFKDFDMDYAQAHIPLNRQETAEGHAVRAVYLYSAMADLADEYGDEVLLGQCETLWNNITQKRMYITGSIGSAAYGERFTTDYDLPNNTNYSETCATIGLAMFSNRMFQITKDGKYTDIVEKAFYNTLLSGIAMDGQHFFYVNPLEVVPEIAEKNPTMSHIKTTRQLWFGVACCPPNIARTLAAMGDYVYYQEGDTLYSNLFISSSVDITVNGKNVLVEMEADYPTKGEIRYTVRPEQNTKFVLAVRKPSYVKHPVLRINGETSEIETKDGYYYIEREWAEGDQVTVEYDVEFRILHCNPMVDANIGKIALAKGPVIYCLEEADNGKHLNSVLIKADAEITEVYRQDLLGGTMCAELSGKRIDYSNAGKELYSETAPEYREDTFTAIPYCYWNNRGKGEMLVWMREEV